MGAFLVYILSGLGAGIGTGLAGLSAAAVIAPALITFLGFPAYEAVGIALASDVLASAMSAYIYAKNKKFDIKNGLIILVAVLIFTMIGSYLAAFVPDGTLGNFSVFGTFLIGIKLIRRPVLTVEENDRKDKKISKKEILQSILSGSAIGLICGFMGAGGGMMILLILTSLLGYELKTAVGTSVFIMAFTAFTGATSHFIIGGMPNMIALVSCVLATLLGAFSAAKMANQSTPEKLNRITGSVLTALGSIMLFVKFIG